MPIYRLLRVTILVIGALVSAPAKACPQRAQAFQHIVSGTDLAAIVQAAREAATDLTCGDGLRAEIMRRAALAHVRAANVEPVLSVRRRIIEAGLQLAQPWQLNATLGHLHLQAGEHGASSLAFQRALIEIEREVDQQRLPSRDEIHRIRTLAEQARLAAPAFVRGTGLMTRTVRGITVEQTLVPIQFVRDSDQMTDIGRQYAVEMAEFLDQQGRPRIVIIGHTDPDGSDEYNLRLSVRRAAAIRQFLVSRGYPAALIEAQGKGESEPLRVLDPQHYSRDQLFQMLRRVEVRVL